MKKILLPILTVTAAVTPFMVSCNKKETKPESITILKAPTKMGVGDEIKLEVKVAPEQAYKGVTWSSSNSNIVSVDQTTGLIKAKAAGSATITAQSDKYKEVEATCNIEVESTPTYEYDLTKEFAPVISPMGGTLTLASATETYLKDASTFKAIVADDIAYTRYILGLTSPSYTKLVVNSVGIDLNNSTISLDMHIDCNIEVTEGTQTAQDLVIEAIPLQVMYGDPGLGFNVWGTTPAVAEGQFFLQDDNWSFYQKDTIDGADVVHEWTKAKLLEEEEDQRTYDIIGIMMALSMAFPTLSYYLSETEAK